MTTPMSGRSLLELVESILNGSALPEECAELERRLMASEADQDFYLNYVNLHSALRRRYLAAADVEAIDDVSEFRRQAAAELLPRKRPAYSARVMLILASLALVVFGFTFWHRFTARWQDEIASILAVEGEVRLITGTGSQPAQPGDAFRPGDKLQVGDSGARAVIDYPDGTQVRVHTQSAVQSPARQEVRLRLLAGSMEVDAAKQPPGEPLVFATTYSRYVVLGTKFRLYHEEQLSRLELDEGMVRVERATGGEAVEVAAGNVAIASESGGPLVIQPLSAGSAKLLQSLPRAGGDVCLAPEGEFLFSNHQGTGLKKWRVEGGLLETEYRDHAGESNGLALTEDGGTLVEVCRDGYVLAWQPDAQESVKLPLPGKHARSRALSPDGVAVAVSADEGTWVLGIELAKKELYERFHFQGSGKAWCMALSPGGNFLAAGFWDGTVQVYNVERQSLVFERRLSHTPTHIAISSSADQIAVFTQRDGIKTIAIATGRQETLWSPGLVTVRSLKFSDDGIYLLAGLNDRTARMWSTSDGGQLLVIDAGHAPQDIAWSEEKQMLVTADGVVKLWHCTVPRVAEPVP